MNRRVFLKAAVAFSSAALAGKAFAKTAPAKPNIIFILADDMGWMDLGCYGSDFYETPNTDKLASEGMRFTDAYAACPVCSPTRASIMTGKYPARLHLTDFIAGKKAPFNKLKLPEWTKYLPNEEETIAERLKSAGYSTACIGKWHLSGRGNERDDATLPEAQGFDVVQDFPGSNMKNGDPKSIYGITEKSLEFIESNKTNPFFLYMSHHAVHLKLEARDEMIEKYKEKKPGRRQDNVVYAGMVEHLDDSVGQVVSKLDELGIADNTIVFFFSDNGAFSWLRGGQRPSNNEPLKWGKGSLYEGGIRVPLIVRWPGAVKPGTTCGVPVSSVDFYPTILEMTHTPDKSKHIVDGLSITSLLGESGKLPKRDIFWHYPHYHHTTPGSAIRSGDFKLIEYLEDGKLELYNLREDIGEKHDLSSKLPETTKKLKAKLDAWRQSVGAQMCPPNPDYDPDKAGSFMGPQAEGGA